LGGYYNVGTYYPVFDGQLSEVRVSSFVRSASWVKATYNALFDTFVTWSEVETYEGAEGPGAGETAYPSVIVGGVVKTVEDMKAIIGEVAKPIDSLCVLVDGQWKGVE
jgi:hypothetical protein